MTLPVMSILSDYCIRKNAKYAGLAKTKSNYKQLITAIVLNLLYCSKPYNLYPNSVLETKVDF